MNRPHRALPLVIVSTSLCLASFPATATTTYRVEELRTLPGSTENELRAIGPTGVVVGSAVAFDTQAVMWDEAGNIIDLTGGSRSYAVGIDVNARNEVPVEDPTMISNFLWRNGGLRQISAPGVLTAINDDGVITGWAPFDRKYRAFTWRDGVTTYLNELANSIENRGTEINNRGQVVGVAAVSGGARRAVIWNQGVPTDLGTLPGFSSSWATAINDAGQVVGHAYTGTGSYGEGTFNADPKTTTGRAFTWLNGSLRELAAIDGAVWTVANGINRDGDVVGYSFTRTGDVAFINQQGSVQDLNRVLGGNSCIAFDLNDAGQIAVGCGYRAFRLTPTAAAVDVGVQLAAPGLHVTRGTPFTYTLTASNSGALPASGVSVSTVLPEGVTLNSIETSEASCSGAATITCAVGDLASGAAATVRITVTPTVTGMLVNSASVSANEADANEVNRSVSLRIEAQEPPAPTADVFVGMSASATRVRVGSELGYSISVSNRGPQAAADVRLTDSLPTGVTLVSMSTSVGSCTSTTTNGVNTVGCSFGNLAQNASAAVNIVVKPTVAGTLTNTARVSAATKDHVPTNNSVTVGTFVRR